MSLEDFDEDLQQLAVDSARRDKLRRDAIQIAAELAVAEATRERWQAMAAEAGEDLQKLEGLSLAGLFHRLLGDRVERIDEEKKKLLHAKLRHDESDAAMAPLVAEQDRVRRELRSIGDVEARRAESLRAKEAALRARGGQVAERLVASADALGGLAAADREIGEAIGAGREAETSLDLACDQLRGARSWGHLDMLGGGFLTTLAKHSRMDHARSQIERTQQHLRRFARELRDVDAVAPNLDIDIGSFERFADWFFDGLLIDWMVQGRIVDALQRAEQTRTNLRQQLWDLERRSQEVRAQLAAAQQQRTSWIRDAD